MLKVPLIVFTALTCVAPPTIPAPVGAGHVYNVPAGTMPFTPSVCVRLNVTPLQVVTDIGDTVASGLSVTVTLNTDPALQLTVVGVTR